MNPLIAQIINAIVLLAAGYGICYFVKRNRSKKELRQIFEATAKYQYTLMEVQRMTVSAEKAMRTNGGTMEVDNGHDSNFRFIVLDKFVDPPRPIIDEVLRVRDCQIRLVKDESTGLTNKEIVFLTEDPSIAKLASVAGDKDAVDLTEKKEGKEVRLPINPDAITDGLNNP